MKTKQPSSLSHQSSWEQHIHDLKAFKKEHGHCNVPYQYQPNPALGQWASGLRYAKKQGRLVEERVRCLDALGFVWVREVSWEQRIHDLKAFKKQHGHCNVPNQYSQNPVLGWWVAYVRKQKKRGTLAKDNILILDTLGFCWVIRKHGIQVSWKQRINNLKAFKKEYGHCKVPRNYQPNPALGCWVSNLRQRKKQGTLTEDRITVLDGLGFSWKRQTTWKQRIHDLKAFKKIHGHCDVPGRYPPNPVLGRWIKSVRNAKNRGILTEDKILILDALGFSWVIKPHGIQVPWKQHINDLKAFKKEHGHCNVHYEYQPNPALGKWVSNLRQRKKRGTLAEDRIIILDRLGFSWKRRVPWNQNIYDLKAFKKIHGHCDVPNRYPPNLFLGRWVKSVRNAKSQGILTEDKVHILNALGFSWVIKPHGIQVPWKQRINDLKAFKKKHGHFNVPTRYQLNPTLGHWVSGLRYAKKHGKLAEDRIFMLDALGFSWVIKPPSIQIPWKQRIHDLKAFKRKHGHCKVPKGYSLNPALGKWVANLRQRKKRGKLTEDKIIMLDGLGFCWDSLLES